MMLMNKLCLSISISAILCFGLLALSGCNTGEDIFITSTPSIVHVEVTESGSDFATAVFTPDDNTMSFKFAIGDATDRNAFIDGTLDGIQVRDGNATEIFTFEGLESDRIYTIFAAGYGEDNTLEAVQSAVVTTWLIDRLQVDNSFVAVDVAAIEVKASFDVAEYTWSLHKGDTASESNRIAGETVSEVYRHVYTLFDLEPTTDYLFVVRYAMRDRETFATETGFTTKNYGEVPAVEFNTLHNDVYYEKYEVRPANAFTGAIASLYQQAAWGWDSNFLSNAGGQGDYAGSIMRLARSGFFFDFHFSEQGGHTFETTSYTLELGVGLEVYAVSCDLDGNIANLQKFSFQNVVYDGTAGVAEVGIEVLNIQPYSVEYKYTPNVHTVGFFVQTFEAEAFEEEYLPQLASDPGAIHDFLYNYYGLSYMIYPNLTGNSWTDTTVQPASEYYAVAAAFNTNGTLGWGKVTYSKFSTPAE